MQRFFQIVAASVVLAACSANEDPGLPTLSVGIQVSPAMTLVMVAEEKGFFDEAGVDVEIEEFTAGKFALQAFLGGSLDVAISGEVPVTLATLQGNEFRVIGQVVDRTVNEVRVVARRDGDVSSPNAFFTEKRRRLATSFGGGPEFYTSEFLKEFGIAPDGVELVSQRPEDMPVALANGTVDAISIFDPFAAIAEARLGEDAVTFKDESLYSELYVIDVREELLSEKRTELISMLTGLRSAQDFIAENPEESKAILIEYTQLEPEIVDAIWENFVFEVAINDLFIDFTTAQAEWYISTGTAEGPVPNFRAVLYTDLLQEVDPAQVKLTGE